jgi:hypothetical protein
MPALVASIPVFATSGAKDENGRDSPAMTSSADCQNP